LIANPVGQLGLGQAVERFGARQSFAAAGAAMLSAALFVALTGRLRGLDVGLGHDDPLNTSSARQ